MRRRYQRVDGQSGLDWGPWPDYPFLLWLLWLPLFPLMEIALEGPCLVLGHFPDAWWASRDRLFCKRCDYELRDTEES